MTCKSLPRRKPVDIEAIREYFSDPRTVDHYVRAVANIGLWKAERAVFEERILRKDRVLDLGCGAGRIAIGLWKMGYSRVSGADFSPDMVSEARSIASFLEADVSFGIEDATRLSFGEDAFDAVVFGFNGLMQIPGWEERRRALDEIFRVLSRKGIFIFTTLDREDSLYREVFNDADNFEHDLAKNTSLIEEGDRLFETEHGTTFMHVPTREEVEQELRKAGYKVVDCRMRSEIAREKEEVLGFSEDCRFWVAKKRAS
ncbi:MAG TPA: class I SAM-dependent methyltransferase [Opitutae bacterium]|nr:methyltransferase type 11 [Opitutaceae bacterium]HCR30840.1 class I SAM-dependent methyltransferase [Opitutae bacterium]